LLKWHLFNLSDFVEKNTLHYGREDINACCLILFIVNYYFIEDFIVFRSSLKEIKKVLRQTYPKPFDVFSHVRADTSYSADFLVIKDFNNKPIAQFKYIKEDGAILTGFVNSPLYKDRYNKIFPTLEPLKNLYYYQQVLDLFYGNTIFKEIISVKEPFKLMEYMFEQDESVIQSQKLKQEFKKIAPIGFKISMGFQYYVHENCQLKPRMKVNFEFSDFGSLILYYDYETNELRFGESQFVDCLSFYKQPTEETKHFNIPVVFGKTAFANFFTIDDMAYYHKEPFKTNSSDKDCQLFGVEPNQAIKSFDELSLIFECWMTEIGVLINQKSSIFYKLDDTFEADSKNNVIENFNLIKMNLI
jgi:hypothetical protein